MSTHSQRLLKVLYRALLLAKRQIPGLLKFSPSETKKNKYIHRFIADNIFEKSKIFGPSKTENRGNRFQSVWTKDVVTIFEVFEMKEQNRTAVHVSFNPLITGSLLWWPGALSV